MLKKVNTKNAFLGIMLLVAAMVMVCGGCGSFGQYNAPTYHPAYKPPNCDLKNASYEDKDIVFAIQPLPRRSFRYDLRIRLFALTVTNKTNRDISIDWGKMYFLNKNGQPDGGFMSDGDTYYTRNNPKQPLLILANTTRTIDIYPNILVDYADGSWFNYSMEEGTFGVYITLDVKGQEKIIKVTVDIGKAPFYQRIYRLPY